MINWRTSRFLLMFFTILLGIFFIAVYTMIDRDQLASWRSYVLSRTVTEPTATVLPSPTGAPAPGQAVELPVYPPVEIEVPARSPFDPAA